MTTMNDLINDTRRTVYGTMADQINIISADEYAPVTTLSFELDISGITPGVILSSGLNVWYVKGSNASTNEVFVIPGYGGAPIGPVTSGDVVIVRPRATNWQLFGMINDEINRMSTPTTGLFRIGQWTDIVDPIWQTYDVPVDDVMEIIRVRYLAPGTPDVWIDLRPMSWKWMTGQAQQRVQLMRYIPAGATVQFVYKASFVKAVSIYDDVVVSCGLSDTMLDIPVLGASVSLLQTTEMRRNQIQQQGDSRRSDEVPASGNAAAASMMRKQYNERMDNEYVRLMRQMPIFRGI